MLLDIVIVGLVCIAVFYSYIIIIRIMVDQSDI